MNLLLLVIDADQPALRGLESDLRYAGFALHATSDVASALQWLDEVEPIVELGACLVSRHVPGASGLQFVRALRQAPRWRDLPLIMLSRERNELDVIEALESGADDFLSEPISSRELVARLRALLRFRQRGEAADRLLGDGVLQLDVASHRVQVAGQPMELGPIEFRLLRYLLENTGRELTRDQLLRTVWSHRPVVDARTVDVHVRRLRAALAPSGYDRQLVTLRGIGYTWSGERTETASPDTPHTEPAQAPDNIRSDS